MVKVKYVALVELEFTFDETVEGSYPFEQIKENIVNGGLTHELRKLIHDEVFDSDHPGVVKGTQQYADMYKVEDDENV